jgi:curved DNA-binding protein CbpA
MAGAPLAGSARIVADKTYYKLLQVDPSADADVIVAAYRVLARRLHPETDFSGIDEYRKKELDRALRVLSDPDQRRSYDEGLAEAEGDASQRVPMGPGFGQQGYTLGDRIQSRDVDRARSMRIDFGRYAGNTLGDLLRSDPDYLRWLSRHSSGIRYRSAILRLLAEQEAIRQPLRVTPT